MVRSADLTHYPLWQVLLFLSCFVCNPILQIKKIYRQQEKNWKGIAALLGDSLFYYSEFAVQAAKAGFDFWGRYI